MNVLLIIFAVSLFLVAVFLAVKEREVYSGIDTGFTLFLQRHSPAVQARAQRFARAVWARLRVLGDDLSRVYGKTLHYVTWGGRAIVVMLAERMIHAVKGEQLLSMRSTSSMYLKHLKEHKDTIAGDAPQV